MMKQTVKSKNTRVSDEALRAVLDVVHTTKRNYKGAADYLIMNGYETFLGEQKILKNVKQSNKENFNIKNTMED